MIFEERKVIFVHYPKTGGNSIQDALREWSSDQIIVAADYQDGVERFEVSNIYDEKLHKHSTLQDYYNSIGEDLFNYTIFINIRNPYDRMVSFFFSPHRRVQHFNRDEFAEFIATVPTIENFIDLKILHAGSCKIPSNINFLVFEELNRGFETMCECLGLRGVTLPHRNASVRGDYRNYYDEELIDIVSKRHRYEIKLGAYKF